MAEQTADEIIQAIKAKQKSFTTNEDVTSVLTFIAPPGEKQELKKEVISMLFTGRSPQGYSIADVLNSYREY